MDITILGGGTAGWITAYSIISFQPNVHNVTVIDSSKIGIIGAGEGSTGLFLDFISGNFFNTRIDISDFIEKTNSTNKMAIRHNNWDKNKQSYIAPLDVTDTGFINNDYIFKYALHKYGKNGMHLSTHLGKSLEKKEYDNIGALHFDAYLVGEYFKNICTSNGVKVIDENVDSVTIDSFGNVESLNLENNLRIKSDLFFDASGFKRIIMNSLDVKWKSYSKFLPVNCAIPFVKEYEDDEFIIPITNATALSSGWLWDIPLKNRRGMGYVFDKNFLSCDEAIKEVSLFLKKEVDPVKIINFDSGRSEYIWKNNCISVGLSSSFVEPLEATSIHNTIVQCVVFCSEFLSRTKEETITIQNINSYNEKISKIYDMTLDFISIHYQGGREDSDFWKYIKNERIVTDRSKDIIERSKKKIIGWLELDSYWMAPSSPLINWILAGIDVISDEIALNDLIMYNCYEIAEERFFRDDEV